MVTSRRSLALSSLPLPSVKEDCSAVSPPQLSFPQTYKPSSLSSCTCITWSSLLTASLSETFPLCRQWQSRVAACHSILNGQLLIHPWIDYEALQHKSSWEVGLWMHNKPEPSCCHKLIKSKQGSNIYIYFFFFYSIAEAGELVTRRIGQLTYAKWLWKCSVPASG